MGTNYYLIGNNSKVEIHLGKRNCGWVFLFQAQLLGDGIIICCLEDMRKLTFGLTLGNVFVIVDEYGNEHTADRFWEKVEATSTAELSWGLFDSPDHFQDQGFDFTFEEFS